MRTVLTAGHSFSDLEGLGAALAQAGAGAGLEFRSAGLAIEPLQQHLADGDCLVLAYVAPAVGVGRALKAAGEGHDLAVADLLGDWRAAGEAMLALAVRHPDRCLLVNADAARAAPALLVDRANAALNLGLNPAAAGAAVSATTALSSLETLLAGALVEGDHESAALFVELQSCAHLGQDESAPAHQMALVAWGEAQAQLARQSECTAAALDKAAARQTALEAQLQRLTHELDQQVSLVTAAADALVVKELEATRQTALAQHLQREGESLLLRLHEAHLESEAFFKQAEQLRSELQVSQGEVAAAQSALLEARRTADAQRIQLLVHAGALQQAQEQLARLEAEHADTVARLADLQADTEGHLQIRQERDRSRVQLMQLNADVARLNESGQRDAVLLTESKAARQMLERFWHNQQPHEVRIDLTRDISGSNWYPPEGDGRWTGPERLSTLSMPALKPGRYSLQMTLVGAMTPQIGAGLRLELNGRQLELSFNRTKHPRVGSASFEAPPNTDGTWVLSLKLPAVESPAGRGSPDQRLLGVRVADIKFIARLEG